MKPNYKKFDLTIKLWEKYNIAYSLNDILELAFKLHCPIPKEFIIDNRVRRDNLVMKLVNYWRKAENQYLETGLNNLKEQVRKIQQRLHLNSIEIELLEQECNNLGI